MPCRRWIALGAVVGAAIVSVAWAVRAAADDEILARLDRIERRLADLICASDREEGTRPVLHGNPTARRSPGVEPPVPAPASVINEEVLAAALERAQESLLERDLTPEERSRALAQLGMTHRATGEYEKSESRLREALDLVGMDSEHGIHVAYQLLWTLSYKGDHRQALRMADDIARSPHADGEARLARMERSR